VYQAVLWDLGGVILTSPFDSFARFERERGLPDGFLRSVNAANHHGNAWARLERNELDVDAFDSEFAAESLALGHEVRGADVLAMLEGDVRPEMVAALDSVKAAGYAIACLTNNVATGFQRPEVVDVLRRFDLIVESSKTGVRKPEPRFYEMACEQLGVAPKECVFLDDLGVNLKPARDMGMVTIKVEDPAAALTELGDVLGLDLAGTTRTPGP
jgi:putative hydrolase of the HAD superfamily